MSRKYETERLIGSFEHCNPEGAEFHSMFWTPGGSAIVDVLDEKRRERLSVVDRLSGLPLRFYLFLAGSLGGYDNAFFSRRKECMHASSRLSAALSVVLICFLTTDSLLAKVGESRQQQDRSGPLTNLKSLHIIVDEVSADGRKAGITESDLEAQTLVDLKQNIPTLPIRDSGPFIGITVNVLENKAVGGQSLGYAAFVQVDVTRPVMILFDDGNSTPVSLPAKVWDKAMLVTGARNDIAAQVKDLLDLFLTQFSADYYKQN